MTRTSESDFGLVSDFPFSAKSPKLTLRLFRLSQVEKNCVISARASVHPCSRTRRDPLLEGKLFKDAAKGTSVRVAVVSAAFLPLLVEYPLLKDNLEACNYAKQDKQPSE